MECGEIIDVLELILKQVVLRTGVSYFHFPAIETHISISILAKPKIGKNQSTYMFLGTEYQTVNHFVELRNQIIPVKYK